MARILLNRAELERGDLPPFCARCGALDAAMSEVLLRWVPSSFGNKITREIGPVAAHAPLVGLFGGVVAMGVIIHGMWAGRRIPIWLPLCERHQRTARLHAGWLRGASFLLALLAIVFTVLAVNECVTLIRQGKTLEGLGLHHAFAFLAFGFACGGLFIRARLHDGFIFLWKMNEEEVELGGVSERFKQELEQSGAGR
jgi:hypothetical protein